MSGSRLAPPCGLGRHRILACLALLAIAAPLGAVDAPADRLRHRLQRWRERRGLAALRQSPLLDAVAQARAEAIARGVPDAALGELLAALAAVGYEAETAAELRQRGASRAERAVDELLAAAGTAAPPLLDGSLADLGVGIDLGGPTPVYVLLLALSRDQAFDRRTASLDDHRRIRGELLQATNQARREAGLAPLRLDPRLSRTAQGYAEEMLRLSFYGHRSPQGSEVDARVAASGYRWQALAENLAAGPSTPQETVVAWLASPDHRRNLLNGRFVDVGFGLAWGKNELGYQILWVQCLGQPRHGEKAENGPGT